MLLFVRIASKKTHPIQNYGAKTILFFETKMAIDALFLTKTAMLM